MNKKVLDLSFNSDNNSCYCGVTVMNNKDKGNIIIGVSGLRGLDPVYVTSSLSKEDALELAKAIIEHYEG